MANIQDITRDAFMLRGPLAKKGYDWWWHSLTAENAETGEKKPFYIEFFTCNPAHAKDEPVIVWNRPDAQKRGERKDLRLWQHDLYRFNGFPYDPRETDLFRALAPDALRRVGVS